MAPLPSQHGAQWNLPLTVRTAAEPDSAAIARIQQASPEAAQWPVGDYSNFRALIALIDTVPAGFCAWRQSSQDEAELLNLAVDPAHRRQKVASALLKALAEVASGTIFLEVAEPNLPAIALYEHHGWVRTGIRKNYYDQGRVNAIVMELRRC
jgi:ribosomal-protein-alanine N-acetyltransferase